MIDFKFQIWDAADAHDRASWIQHWEQWPEREVFAHPNYLLLYVGPHVRALCAAMSIAGSHVLYPFLLRSLAEEPYCDASLHGCTDITSPYGYGGPFAWGAVWNSESCDAFWRQFNLWAATSDVVSEVIRLSLFSDTLMPYLGDKCAVSENIVRTLPRSGNGLWRDFEHKVRKNVNRAKASGVTVRMDETGECLDEFLAIYAGTMSRRNAPAVYDLSREYFEQINCNLMGQFIYFHALLGSSIISTELVLVSERRIYSFLGGTDATYFHLRPNDLLKMEIMNWAHEAGKSDFVLGGGYKPGDGIYRYKLSFAPAGSVPFSIGSRILCSNAYERLIESRRLLATVQGCEWEPQPGFFPAYRG